MSIIEQKGDTMKSIMITLGIGIFVMVTGFQVFSMELTAEQNEIWNITQKGWESIKKADLEAVMSDWHEKGFSLFSMDPQPLTKDQVRSSYEGWMSGAYKVTSYELKPLTINITENVATVFYYFKWEAEAAGFSSKGRTIDIYLKQNGKWLLISTMSASCDKPAPCPYGW
jgi:ketosteroid isomerase-like protein